MSKDCKSDYVCDSSPIADLNGRTDSLIRKERIRTVSPSSKEVLVLVPVLNFISRFAAQSDPACQIALDAGVLDILLRIYIIFPTLSDSTGENAGRKVALRDACQSTLGVLSQSQHQEAIIKHPVCILWKDVHSQPPRYTIDAPTNPDNERSVEWRRVEKSCVERRMIIIYNYALWKPRHDGNVDEACIDIVEFTKSALYHSSCKTRTNLNIHVLKSPILRIWDGWIRLPRHVKTHGFERRFRSKSHGLPRARLPRGYGTCLLGRNPSVA